MLLQIERATLKQRINQVIRDIKAQSGWKPGTNIFDNESMALVQDSFACFEGRPVGRKILIFRSNGCHWAQERGCSMCGYFVETAGEAGVITPENYVTQLRRELERIDLSSCPVVCLFTAGSFLDNWEFAWEAAQDVFRLLGNEPHIKKVIIESCAQYTDESKLRRLRGLIGDKTVEVGIGLECADPFILNNCVNKEFTMEKYEQKAAIIRKYFDVLCYVLVKPPFLNEREALELAVKTGRFAFDTGAQAISLEPMYIEKHTLVDFLFKNGYLYNDESYRCPWLWTVFEAAQRIKAEYPDREVRIGYSDELNSPYERALNCKSCTDEAYRRIIEYSKTYDIGLLSNFDCECRSRWQAEIDELPKSEVLKDAVAPRIKAFLESYDSFRV